MGACGAFLKSKRLERHIYVAPPLVAEADPATMRKLIRALYWISESCKECYIPHKRLYSR